MKKDLFTVLKQIYKQSPVFKADTLFHSIANLSDTSIINFFEHYIAGDSCPVFDNYLNKAGMKIEQYEKTIWYSFRIGGFEYDPTNKNLSVTFMNKPDCFEHETVIITGINDLPISSFTFGQIFNRLEAPRKIKITYIENDSEKTAYIEQQGTIREFKEIKTKDTLTEKEQKIFNKLFKIK